MHIYLTEKRFVVLSALIIFLIPIINQLIYGGNNLGGDSTRLYLNFPFQWISNYSIHLSNLTFPDNPFNNSYIQVPQLFIFYLLNKIFFSSFTMFFHNSFIAVTAFFGILMLLDDLFKKKLADIKNYSYCKIICSTIYVFSCSYSWSIFNNGGSWVYVYSSLPILVSLVYRFCIEGKYFYLVILFLLFNIFSSIFLYQMLPFTIPTIMYLLLAYSLNLKKITNKNFFKKLLLVILLITIFNIPNIYYAYYDFIGGVDFRYQEDTLMLNYIANYKENIDIIQNNFYPLLNLPSLKLFSISGFFINKYWFILNLYLVVQFILLGYIFFNFYKNITTLNKYHLKLAKQITVILILGFLFINPGFNEFIKYFFFKFLNIFDFMGIFRGFNHKFTFGFSIIYCVFIFYILVVGKIFFKKIKYVAFLLYVVTLVPALIGAFYNIPILYTKDIKPLNGISNDTYELIKIIKNENELSYNGNMISLPPRHEYFLDFHDGDKGYVSQSPISLISGTILYYSMSSQKSKKIFNEIFSSKDINKKYQFLKENHINYILFNKKNYEEYFAAYQFNYDKKILNKFIEKIKKYQQTEILYDSSKYQLLKINNNVNKCLNFKKYIFYYSLINSCNNEAIIKKEIDNFADLNSLKKDWLLNLNSIYEINNIYNEIKIYDMKQMIAFFAIFVSYILSISLIVFYKLKYDK